MSASVLVPISNPLITISVLVDGPYEQECPVLKPGGQITGTVIVDSNQLLKVKYVSLMFTGEQTSKWIHEHRPDTPAFMSSVPRMGSPAQSAPRFSETVFEEKIESGILPVGRTVFPFSWLVPSGIPTTFTAQDWIHRRQQVRERSDAQVRFRLEAKIVDREEIALRTDRIAVLVCDDTAQIRTSKNDEIELTATLQKSSLLIGEPALLLVQLKNSTNSDKSESVHLNLIQTSTLDMTHGRSPSVLNEDLCSVRFHLELAPHSKVEHNVWFGTPSTRGTSPPIYTSGTEGGVTTRHTLVVAVHNGPAVTFPIHIGSVSQVLEPRPLTTPSTAASAEA